jgi:predicted small metal-binding protein
MAYEFECTNVIPGCEGKVEGETVDDVLLGAATHAKDVHGLDQLDDATIEVVKNAIVEWLDPLHV